MKELSDLELAALICLVADEHCIIAADDDFVDDLENELRLVWISSFMGTSVLSTHRSRPRPLALPARSSIAPHGRLSMISAMGSFSTSVMLTIPLGSKTTAPPSRTSRVSLESFLDLLAVTDLA